MFPFLRETLLEFEEIKNRISRRTAIYQKSI